MGRHRGMAAELAPLERLFEAAVIDFDPQRCLYMAITSRSRAVGAVEQTGHQVDRVLAVVTDHQTEH